MSQDKIFSLITSKAEANQEIVGILEILLEQAKSGEIVGFSYASILKNGDSQTQCSQSDNFQQLIGAMRILEFRMLDESRSAK